MSECREMFNFAPVSDIVARRSHNLSLKYSANVTDNKLFEAVTILISQLPFSHCVRIRVFLFLFFSCVRINFVCASLWRIRKMNLNLCTSL